MTPEARGARERKQKIFVVVGGLLLVGLLAIQLPRMLGGSEPTSSATGTTEIGTSTTPAPAPAAPSTPVRVAAASTTTLRSFSEFSRKNPFVQQVDYEPAPAGSTTTSNAKQEAPGETAEAVKDFSVGTKPAAAVTVISVNGDREAVVVGAAFPAKDPVFLLLAERPERRSVLVGVSGGTYANGARTTALTVGKPLVLVNTTTGARYRLALVVVGTGAPPASEVSKSP